MIALEVRPLLSDEHFLVDGTLLLVAASHASLERIDGQVDHRATVDPAASAPFVATPRAHGQLACPDRRGQRDAGLWIRGAGCRQSDGGCHLRSPQRNHWGRQRPGTTRHEGNAKLINAGRQRPLRHWESVRPARDRLQPEPPGQPAVGAAFSEEVPGTAGGMGSRQPNQGRKPGIGPSEPLKTSLNGSRSIVGSGKCGRSRVFSASS